MYTTTLSSKGQMVLPKKLRDALGVGPQSIVELVLDKKRTQVIIKSGKDIVDLAGTIQPKKKIVSAVLLRKKFEKGYERF